MDAMYIIGEVKEVELNSYTKKGTGEVIEYTEVTMHYDFRDSKGKRRMDTERVSLMGDHVSHFSMYMDKWIAFPFTKRSTKEGLAVFPDGEGDVIVFGDTPHKRNTTEKKAA